MSDLCVFFSPSAARHRALSRNKQNRRLTIARNRKPKTKTAQTTTRATPIPPARIGIPRKEKPQNRTISESTGRQASPDKKPIKMFHLYKSKQFLAKYQESEPKRSFAKNLLHFSLCACHPCAGAMLIFSVSFQFYRMIPEGNPCE